MPFGFVTFTLSTTRTISFQNRIQDPDTYICMLHSICIFAAGFFSLLSFACVAFHQCCLCSLPTRFYWNALFLFLFLNVYVRVACTYNFKENAFHPKNQQAMLYASCDRHTHTPCDTQRERESECVRRKNTHKCFSGQCACVNKSHIKHHTYREQFRHTVKTIRKTFVKNQNNHRTIEWQKHAHSLTQHYIDVARLIIMLSYAGKEMHVVMDVWTAMLVLVHDMYTIQTLNVAMWVFHIKCATPCI